MHHHMNTQEKQEPVCFCSGVSKSFIILIFTFREATKLRLSFSLTWNNSVFHKEKSERDVPS